MPVLATWEIRSRKYYSRAFDSHAFWVKALIFRTDLPSSQHNAARPRLVSVRKASTIQVIPLCSLCDRDSAEFWIEKHERRAFHPRARQRPGTLFLSLVSPLIQRLLYQGIEKLDLGLS